MPSAEPDVVLCVDFGSTFTKASLVDLTAGSIVGAAEHRTTIDTDVLDGYDACLASLASVVAIQIQKSNNYEEHIVRAQELRAALEVLEVSITCGSLTIHKATSQFLKCLEDSSFMEPAR